MPGEPVLLVLADSLAFHGPQRAEPADDPRLWPNVAAAALGIRAELVAGAGWTARHAWHALTRDPRVWAVLPRVRALVLGVGGMDTLPSPVPTAIRELIPVLRPDALRRAVRDGYLRALPLLARALSCRRCTAPPATAGSTADGCRQRGPRATGRPETTCWCSTYPRWCRRTSSAGTVIRTACTGAGRRTPPWAPRSPGSSTRCCRRDRAVPPTLRRVISR